MENILQVDPRNNIHIRTEECKNDDIHHYVNHNKSVKLGYNIRLVHKVRAGS